MFFVAITNSSPSSEPAVVEISHGDVLVCTGTVVAPHAVLTAAHCLTDSVLPDGAVGSFSLPNFDRTTLVDDLAVMIVDPPLPMAPLLYSAADRLQPTVTVIGFGLTSAGDLSPASQRSGTSMITASNDLTFDTVGAPSQTCEGDSGGPALDSAGTIVGVASSGDVMCSDHAVHTRTFAHADFILDAVERSTEGFQQVGERCFYAANCASGTCATALDDPRLAFCATACGSCPGSLSCIDGLCRHEISPSATGSTCSVDSDCIDHTCREHVCTTTCFADLPDTCPAGFACNGEVCAVKINSGGCQSGHEVGWLAALFACMRMMEYCRRRGQDRRARDLRSVPGPLRG